MDLPRDIPSVKNEDELTVKLALNHRKRRWLRRFSIERLMILLGCRPIFIFGFHGLVFSKKVSNTDIKDELTFYVQ